jgi:hypothetical protein
VGIGYVLVEAARDLETIKDTLYGEEYQKKVTEEVEALIREKQNATAAPIEDKTKREEFKVGRIIDDGFNYLNEASEYLAFIDETMTGDCPIEQRDATIEAFSHLARGAKRNIDTVIAWIEQAQSTQSEKGE